MVDLAEAEAEGGQAEVEVVILVVQEVGEIIAILSGEEVEVRLEI